MTRMRELRQWAGQPSLRRLRLLGGQIRATTGEPVDALPVSTTGAVLAGKRLPRRLRGDFVGAFVLACLRAARLDNREDSAHLRRWLDALARCQGSLDDPGFADEWSRDELPPSLVDFAGRAEVLRWMTHPRSGPVVLAVNGMPGIGKTALGIETGRRLDRPRTTRLCIDLRGSAEDGPAHPSPVLSRLLLSVGVPERRIPESLEEREALWRATTMGRRLFVLFDDASDSSLVRPLLPSSPEAVVIVTSRRRLSGLDGADVLSLRPMSDGEAMQMFTRIVGRRAQTEDAHSRRLLKYCAGVPYAIRLAGERLVHRPTWTVGYLAERLWAPGGFAELQCGERSAQASFDRSYRMLPTAAQRFARTIAGRAELDLATAAQLAGCSAAECERLVHRLVDANLMIEQVPGRYRFNRLVKTFLLEGCR